MKLNSIIAMALCLSAASMGFAQDVPKPLDRPYPGILELHVDATNVAQKIFKVHERIPAKAGPITLLYPQWLLGAHAPADSSLAQFAGLTLSADRHRIEWQRDPVNMHAFHATVPAGASALEADFVFLSPLEGSEGAINRRRPLGWMSYQRAEDYYSEGEPIWLDVDTKIRELSDEKHSLDDWARNFFGVQNGRRQPLDYTLKDVVASLNAVQPYDWQGFLSTRLEGHGPGAPLGGITRAGWKLAYGETPTDFFKDVEAYRKVSDFYYSLGVTLDSSGRIADVLWNSPAFKAGLSQGFTVIAVNGQAYKPEVLKNAISAARAERQPIELLLRHADRYQTTRIDYHEGMKYPRLERIDGTPDRLAAIFRPLP